MTPRIASAVTAKIIQRITAATGVNSNLAELTSGDPRPLEPLNPAQIRTANVPADVVERSNAVHYPSLNVYCEKIVNSQVEKFRTFSGTLQMAIEFRYSQDRLEGIQDSLEVYVDAVLQVLDTNRGDWSDGMYFTGAYQAALSPVKHGGRNFIQIAKITFEIGVSIN